MLLTPAWYRVEARVRKGKVRWIRFLLEKTAILVVRVKSKLEMYKKEVF